MTKINMYKEVSLSTYECVGQIICRDKKCKQIYYINIRPKFCACCGIEYDWAKPKELEKN